MQTVKVTFTLPAQVAEDLAKYSNEFGEKKSHMVAEALNQYFDILDLKLAVKRSQDVKKGKVKPVSFDEIKRELGL